METKIQIYCQFTHFSKLIYVLFVLCACIDYHHFKSIIRRQEAGGEMLWFCRIVNDLMWCRTTFYCRDKCMRIFSRSFKIDKESRNIIGIDISSTTPFSEKKSAKIVKSVFSSTHQGCTQFQPYNGVYCTTIALVALLIFVKHSPNVFGNDHHIYLIGFD